MVEFGCHYHRIHAQMSMKIISRERLFSYQFTLFGWLQRPSGWRSLLILPCRVIFPSRAGEYAEDLAAGVLATTVEIEFNPELHPDAREDLLRCQGRSSVRATSLSPLLATKSAQDKVNADPEYAGRYEGNE
jgi:hypothetical protein